MDTGSPAKQAGRHAGVRVSMSLCDVLCGVKSVELLMRWLWIGQLSRWLATDVIAVGPLMPVYRLCIDCVNPRGNWNELDKDRRKFEQVYRSA